MQGSTHFLLTSQLATINAFVGRPKDCCLLWRLCSGMDRGGRGDDADQAVGRKHVSGLRLGRLKFADGDSQLLFPVNMHHWLHTLPAGHRRDAQRSSSSNDRPHPCLCCPHCMVFGRRRQYLGGLRGRQEPCRHSSIPIVRILRWPRVFVLH